MAVAVAVWSITVEPGEPTVLSPASDVRITNVALGDEIEEDSRTTLKLIYRLPHSPEGSDEEEEEEEEEDDALIENVVLCSLTPGKIEQATIDLVLEEDQEYLFQLVGKNTLHLSGNYIDQRPPDMPPYDDESDEEALHLEDVSSDVEMDPEQMNIPSDDDADRFEEVKDDEEPKKDASKKRARESDTTEVDGTEKLSKAERKKLNKKLKGENGEAVTPAENPAEKKKELKKEKANKNGEGEKKKGEEKKSGETKTLEGGLKFNDHKVGSGAQAKKGDRVQMRYVGKLQNGTIFDKNTKGKPFSFRLGAGEVIKGWDVGIVGMAVGGERLLTIPPALGYGKQKQQGIPPNSTLTFEVKLVGIN